MIVWLASYPRSGNTLLRIILRQCFGLLSQSLYSDQEFPDPQLRQTVGEDPVGADPQAFLADARQQGKVLFVKTHELPHADNHPAIYVVRDGRAALVSHFHYLRNVLRRPVSLDSLIAGEIFPSWSVHVTAWALSGRDRVLVLRYEDLVSNTANVLPTIADFIGKGPEAVFDLTFADLHRQMPHFFRVGSNEKNIAEMSKQQLERFDAYHGRVAAELGYYSPSA